MLSRSLARSVTNRLIGSRSQATRELPDGDEGDALSISLSSNTDIENKNQKVRHLRHHVTVRPKSVHDRYVCKPVATACDAPSRSAKGAP